jgi:NAD(P)H-hydrate repair Nnr-like enzyme with NAD(P)H-hydrate epimerase domain
MMNGQTALLTTRQMAEADRLSVVSGLSIIDLMDRAGSAVAREIGRRWKARPRHHLPGRDWSLSP